MTHNELDMLHRFVVISLENVRANVTLPPRSIKIQATRI